MNNALQPKVSQPNASPYETQHLEGQPWWRFGHMWLVVGGPFTVVIASFITLYLAISVPDPVVDVDYYRKGIEINKSLDAKHDGLVPAMQGRNHAATGVKQR